MEVFTLSITFPKYDETRNEITPTKGRVYSDSLNPNHGSHGKLLHDHRLNLLRFFITLTLRPVQDFTLIPPHVVRSPSPLFSLSCNSGRYLKTGWEGGEKMKGKGVTPYLSNKWIPQVSKHDVHSINPGIHNLNILQSNYTYVSLV